MQSQQALSEDSCCLHPISASRLHRLDLGQLELGLTRLGAGLI